MKWKKIYQEKSILVEKTIPSDEDSIMASFENDVSDQKFSPSKEFLRVAYGILNDKFFHGELPEGLNFQVKTQPTKSYVGFASYVYDRPRDRIWATGVTLNGSRTLTMHEWLEVVLHEMIHVLDYETNPSHFLGYMGKSYDAHGYWFLTEGEKYTKYGFHVQKYCNADIGVNIDDKKVQKRINNSVFLFMQGNRRPLIMKMSRKSLDRNLDYITSRMNKPWSTFGQGVKEIKIMTSENPKISLLKDLRMRDSTSRISWWWFDDEFEKKYGPFELEDTVKILSAKNKVNEDDAEDKSQEVDGSDNEPETPDEVIDEIQDNVEGVSDVKEVSDDKFVVSIP